MPTASELPTVYLLCHGETVSTALPLSVHWTLYDAQKDAAERDDLSGWQPVTPFGNPVPAWETGHTDEVNPGDKYFVMKLVLGQKSSHYSMEWG